MPVPNDVRLRVPVAEFVEVTVDTVPSFGAGHFKIDPKNSADRPFP
jgi:hypothetical protein